MAHPTLILGGARSGKSRLAEGLVGMRRPVVYIATACVSDAAMADRVRQHRQRRPADWRTMEVARSLPEAVRESGSSGGVVLVDCVTIWLSNLMLGYDSTVSVAPAGLSDEAIEAEVRALADAGRDCRADVIWVSSEVGGGIVPDNPLGRRFRDVAGQAHQILAAAADRVLLCVAGLPLSLK